jgi:hypothetical protein
MKQLKVFTLVVPLTLNEPVFVITHFVSGAKPSKENEHIPEKRMM